MPPGLIQSEPNEIAGGYVASNCYPVLNRQTIFDKMTKTPVDIADDVTIMSKSGKRFTNRRSKMARCKFKAGDNVVFDGGVWVVVEWQPLNGIGGCYWIRNANGESATATVSELVLVIDPKKYGTASEVAEAVGVARTTLITAAKRGEIKHAYTIGQTLLIEVAAAKQWAKGTRKTGPKPKD